MKCLKLGFTAVLIFATLGLGLFSGCSSSTDSGSSDSSETENTTDSTEETTEESESSNIGPDVISDIIESIPHPIEVSTLIQQVGTEYNAEALNDHTMVDNYTTNYKKALNLGVYSTDLGYANIYEKNNDVLNFLNSLKKLADGLSIGQFFDYSTIKKLASSRGNLDSLLSMTTQNFEKINYHLKKQKREHLSILILTGGWLEATHLTTLVYKSSNDQQLRDKIGEQKLVLKRILIVLEVFKDKPNFSTLINDLKELEKVYDKVNITVTRGQPSMVVKDGELIIETDDQTSVEMTDEDIETISSLIESIRNKIVN